MATTRKRARTDAGQFKSDDPSTPERNEAFVETAARSLPVSVDSLAAFMGVEQPDIARFAPALELASTAAANAIGRAIRDAEPHPISHGIHMLAAQLLMKDALDSVPSGAEIPGVVRYLWKTAA